MNHKASMEVVQDPKVKKMADPTRATEIDLTLVKKI